LLCQPFCPGLTETDKEERQKEVFRRISQHIGQNHSNIQASQRRAIHRHRLSTPFSLLSVSSQTMFREIDKDGKGGISRSELASGFDQIGMELTDGELKAVFDVCDANGL